MRLIRVAMAAILFYAGGMPPSGPVLAGEDDDTIVWAGARELHGLDMYRNAERESIAIGRAVFDTLLWRDPESFELKPHLAESWRWRDATTLVLTLRRGVTFHDGSPFDARDVVYTLERAMASDADPRGAARVRWIRSVAAEGDHIVAIRLEDPFPLALQYLATTLVIYPRGRHAEAGAAAFARSPVGTGPFRVAEPVAAGGVVLVRNEAFFGGARERPTVGRVVYRPVADAAARAEALRDGDVDFVWRIADREAALLAGASGVSVQGAETMRFGFLAFDAAGRNGGGPVRDGAVRLAVAHAIDRAAIVDGTFDPGGAVLDLPCFPRQFGCAAPGGGRFPDHAPDRATALLAGAGHGGGLALRLLAAQDRPTVNAIVRDLAAVGIRADLEWLSLADLLRRVHTGKGGDLVYLSWGSAMLGDVAASTSHFFTGSADDLARDEAVSRRLRAGDGRTDPAERAAAYGEAIDRIVDRVYWLPVGTHGHRYATRAGLDLPLPPDEVPLFERARWR